MTSHLKQQAVEIFLRTLDAIDVREVFDRKIRVDGDMLFAGDSVVDLGNYSEVVAIGLGKASLKMGKALEDTLRGRLTRGVLVSSRQDGITLGDELEVLVGGHPVPSEGSLKAGSKLMEVAGSCSRGSLIIFLISGGGSALAESLAFPEMSLEELKHLNKILIGCGASIEEINTVRKCISRIKGGGLGRTGLDGGADSLVIYISDVNPGDLRSIASNPVLPEPSVRERALSVARRFGLTGVLPPAVLQALSSGEAESGDVQSPGAGSGRVLGTVLICDNSMAVEAAGRIATEFGFSTYTYADLVEGDYREVADQMISRLWELKSRSPARPLCVISGGEVSCVVSGKGAGGRNQQFVLYSATKLAEQCVGTGPVAVLSCGTDGIDGNSPAAGAVSDRRCIEEAIRSGLDPGLYLRENDSFSFFSKMGGLVLTGATGTNVRDIRIMLSAPDG